MTKITCNSCEHFKVCMSYSLGRKYNRDASKCPEYREWRIPHELELNKLKADIMVERSKVTKLSCDVQSTDGNYEVSYQQQLSAQKSVKNNGLSIVDGKLCWRNPETESWEPADSAYIQKHYGIVFEPHSRHVCRRGTAKHRLDAGNHLHHAKGFDEVIIRAAIQTHDTVILCSLGAGHNDRDAGGFLSFAQASENGHAALAG